MTDIDTAIDPLVVRCRQGDQAAWRELFQRYGRMIQSITFRMTRNAEAQKDIFQEVVMRVVSAIGDFRGGCKFSTWLYRIAANTAIRYVEKENRYARMADVDSEALGLAAQDPAVLDRLTSRETHREVTQAMTLMPEKYREVFSLFYFADVAVDEIARHLGTSEGAVKAILFKGRKALAKHLRRKGHILRI